MMEECRLLGFIHRVALVRTDVSEERIASTIRMTRIDDVGRTLAVPSNRSTHVTVSYC
jgi:hypothetical protein